MESLWPITLFAVSLCGGFLTLLGLPGNWLIVGVTAAYTYFVPAPSWSIGWPVVIGLGVLAAIGELIELLAAAAGVRKRGGSRRGMALALVGSLVGGLIGLFVGIPVPLVGPVIAALVFAGLGALVGAVAGEQWKGRDLEQSWRIGKAAFWGRLWGTLAKTLIGLVMMAVVGGALAL